MMSMQSQRSEPEISPAEHRPVELITENGFSIMRSWEIEHVAPPVDGGYRFVVRGEEGSERTIIVAVTAEVVTQITLRTCGRIRLSNSFWIYAAERHLANYLEEQNDYPAGDNLLVEDLDSEDCLLALRWETT
jgi:hypothetical protein